MLGIMYRLLLRFLPSSPISAHCDIPCGIYDPHAAQVAAHTVIRMTQLIEQLHTEGNDDKAKKLFFHQLSRYTAVKEEHAETVKREVRVIWGDYFKEEHLKTYPQLHEKVFQIMKLTSKTRQSIDMESAQQLLAAVQEFAEIFWKTKGRETVHITSPYPTEGELVLPK
ncbi:MAG TPA: superoxide dismutase, Ni [Patescibacteria group bacterium]|nr:superoxide dismutase, Ni [Patescibacteria group bacterium]